ncbi:5'/3'-nucleotidase SurE [Crateriforma conspicua]|uniref:5'/3'-nucleotidase SurE n=1 Tax=Crateriforma TaxID=2714592 RepID=UPI0011B703DB|nr:5'/3'-nucleotidase SurE [Crateriforma conspicua]
MQTSNETKDSQFRILLTNDDGIDAPGIAAMEKSVRGVLDSGVVADLLDQFAMRPQIIVAAPDQCRSECGHGVTTGRVLEANKIKDDRYSVDGTPVDCVRAFAISHQVDAVLSGVNAGANLGVDLLVSGTFAAAREASSHGIASLAASQYRHPGIERRWDHVPVWMRTVLEDFLTLVIQNRQISDRPQRVPLWNVNMPALPPESEVPPRVLCDVDRLPHARTVRHEDGRIHFDLNFQNRPREKGRDVDQCFAGNITISQLGFTVC